MRICIVTIASHGVGGMQDHTRMLARGLVEAGHDVDVVTTRHPDGLRVEERHGARWHFVDAGSQHARLPRRDPAWLPASVETVLQLDARGRLDVIHSESTSAIGLVRRGVHRQIPTVLKFHGSGLAHARAHLRRFRARGLSAKVREAKGLVWLFGVWFQHGQLYRFRQCNWMVPSLREFDDTRRSHLLKRDLGYVVPNGVDTRVFTPRPRAVARSEIALDADVPLFVCAGRLDRGKGTHHAIRALRRLANQGASARLVVIGSGPDRERLEALARELDLTSHVVFTGAQPHEVLARYLGAADAFVFPSELNEAAPLIPLQALACGTPVIASNVGSVAELMGTPGKSGLLVRPGDPGALAEAMGRIAADTRLRATMGHSAVARVHAEYTLEKMVERTVAVYEIARERTTGPRQ